MNDETHGKSVKMTISYSENRTKMMINHVIWGYIIFGQTKTYTYVGHMG